jgi:hypothetical protein
MVLWFRPNSALVSNERDCPKDDAADAEAICQGHDDVVVTGMNRVFGRVTAYCAREKGSCVTTSLLALASGLCGASVQVGLFAMPSSFVARRKRPWNAIFNVYRSSDETWFLIVLTPDRWPSFATGFGRRMSSVVGSNA